LASIDELIAEIDFNDADNDANESLVRSRICTKNESTRWSHGHNENDMNRYKRVQDEEVQKERSKQERGEQARRVRV
jgi:hypothetical protein